ncbi:hypothetical protein ONZ45_g19170 [Pleurotus djamor]|nr:hypothetical protein ONZ45_g19170 [Pleurotus djamor]
MLSTVYCASNVSPIEAYPIACVIARKMGNRLGQGMALVLYIAENSNDYEERTAYAKVYRRGFGSRHLYTLDMEGRTLAVTGATASRPETLNTKDLIAVCSLDKELLG